MNFASWLSYQAKESDSDILRSLATRTFVTFCPRTIYKALKSKNKSNNIKHSSLKALKDTILMRLRGGLLTMVVFAGIPLVIDVAQRKVIRANKRNKVVTYYEKK